MFPKATFAPIGCVSGPLSIAATKERKNVFLIDLNTLTTSPDAQIAPEFAGHLVELLDEAPGYLLTNTSYEDVLERLPGWVRSAFAGIFAAAGTELWKGNEAIVRHEHAFSDDLYEYVAKTVQASNYTEKRALTLSCGSATLRIRRAGTANSARYRKSTTTWEKANSGLPEIKMKLAAKFPEYRIYRDSESSLLITPRSYSTEMVRGHIARRHKSARIVSYFTPQAGESFAKPLCDCMGQADICSVICGPSDVSQLIAYEKRQLVSGAQASSVMRTPAVGSLFL